MLDEPYVKKMLYFQNHALGQPLYKSRLSPLLSYFKTPRKPSAARPAELSWEQLRVPSSKSRRARLAAGSSTQ